jgi:hypothetical protein
MALLKSNFRFPERQVIFDYLGYIAVAAVAVVLLMGLVNMFRGGSSNTSQKLMRWRVGLQFVAIVVLMLGLYISQR